MSEQTGKHAAAQDEYLEQQTRRGVAHAEEFHRIEPAALDDEPERISHRTSGAGSPRQGMSQGEIDLRSRIAAALGRSAFPGDRERLIEVATGNRAEDRGARLLASPADGPAVRERAGYRPGSRADRGGCGRAALTTVPLAQGGWRGASGVVREPAGHQGVRGAPGCP